MSEIKLSVISGLLSGLWVTDTASSSQRKSTVRRDLSLKKLLKRSEIDRRFKFYHLQNIS